MKRIILKYTLLLCLAMVLLPQANANVSSNFASDSTIISNAKKSRDVKKRYVAGNYGFNSVDYVMQSRFRHSDKLQYSNKGLLSHMFIGASFGYEYIADRKDFEYNPDVAWGLTIGKELSKLNAVSLMFKYGSNTDKRTEAIFKRMSLQLNHHFNFTRYYLGYNPFRNLEFISTVGLGVQSGSIWDEDYTSPFLYFGLQTALRLGNNIDFVVEPHVAIGGEGYNGAPKGYYYSKYNVSYGATATLKYTMENELTGSAYVENMLFPREYFYFDMGVQSMNSNLTIFKTIAPSFTLGYGRWMARRFALQAGLGWSAGGWARFRHNGYDLDSKQQFLFGRVEGVVNLFSTFKNIKESNNGFSVNLSAGYEFGHMWKYYTSVENQQSDNYGGFTGALRFRYHVGEGKALYLEPRVTYANYGNNYGAPYKETKKAALDTRYNLSLGMEYGSPYLNGVGREELEDEFSPSFSALAYGGPSYVMNRGTYNGYAHSASWGYSFGVGAEYQPFRLFGARVLLDLSSYGLIDSEFYTRNGKQYRALSDTRTNVTSGIFDIKLDLTNLFYGYRRDRRWNASLYAGPILSYTSSIDGSVAARADSYAETNLGGHLGFNTRYTFGNGFGVFGEADFRVYKNEFLPGFDNLDYNPVRILGARLGAHYTFDASKSFADAYSEILFPRDYFFFGAGVQSLNSELTIFKTIGPIFSLGYGHWFNRYFGYQLSGGWSTGGWQRFRHNGYDLDSKQQFLFGRGELMINTFNNVNESGRGFSLAALGGLEVGKLWRYRTTLENQTEAAYVGFTGGVRAKYHVGEGKAFYFEPRVTFAHYDDDKIYMDKSANSLSTRYNLSLGMEYGSPYLNGVGREELEDEFSPSFSALAYGGPSYVMNRGTYNGYAHSASWGYSFGVGAEYQPFRLFGARVLLDLSSYGLIDSEFYTRNGKQYRTLSDTRTNVTSGIFDIKLDLTNLFYGYRRDRRWNASLYAGPILSYTSSIDGSVAARADSYAETNLGGHLGFNTRYTFGNGFGVFGEADFRVYKNEFLPGFDNLDYNPVRILGARLGVTYNIK